MKRNKIENPKEEIQRVNQAVKISQKQLQKLYDKAVTEVREASERFLRCIR